MTAEKKYHILDMEDDNLKKHTTPEPSEKIIEKAIGSSDDFNKPNSVELNPELAQKVIDVIQQNKERETATLEKERKEAEQMILKYRGEGDETLEEIYQKRYDETDNQIVALQKEVDEGVDPQDN